MGGYSRREFIRNVLVGSAGVSLTGIAHAQQSGRKVPIIIPISEKAVKLKNSAYREICKKMVDTALTKLTGTDAPEKAWKKFIPSGGTVGLKINNESTRTDKDLVMAIADSMIAIGQPAEKIIIFERSDFDVTQGGFQINNSGKGVQCYGVARAEWHGSSAEQERFHPKEYDVDGHKICVSKMVTDTCQLIINVPVIKKMSMVGMSCSLKNHFGSIDSPYSLHKDDLHKHIALNAALPPLKEKTKLVICDGVRHFGDQHIGIGGIIVSTDQVAVDYVAAGIVEDHIKGELNPPARYIHEAAKLGLGTDKKEEMDIQKITIA